MLKSTISGGLLFALRGASQLCRQRDGVGWVLLATRAGAATALISRWLRVTLFHLGQDLWFLLEDVWPQEEH